MITLRHVFISSLLLSITTLLACGEPTPEEVQDRLFPVVEDMTAEVQNSLDVLQEMDTIKPLIDDWLPKIFGKKADSNKFFKELSEATKKSNWADETKQFLKTYIFTEQNVESTAGDSITYLLRGQAICAAAAPSSTTCITSTPGEQQCFSQFDSEKCASSFDALQIRIVAKMLGSDGVELRLSIRGVDMGLALRFEPSRIDWVVDLAHLKAALVSFTQQSKQAADDLPQKMEGTIRASLIKHAPGDLSIETAVEKNVAIEGIEDLDEYKIHIEAKNPITALRLQKSQKALSWNIDLGAVDVFLPAKEMFKNTTGTVEVLLRGLNAAIKLQKGQDLLLENLGIGNGSSYLKLNNTKLVEIELNAENNHRFNLEIKPWQDLPKAVISPLLDLQITLNLAPVAQSLDADLNSDIVNETYRVQLSKPNGTPAIGFIDCEDPSSGILKMLEGNLKLQSILNPAEVIIPEGSCLALVKNTDTESHPSLNHFKAVSCQAQGQ